MKTKKIIFFAFFVLNSFWVLADPTPPPVLPDGSTASAPIDSGLLALVAGGVLLGIRKWQSRKTV